MRAGEGAWGESAIGGPSASLGRAGSTPVVLAAQALLDAACRLRSVLEDDDAALIGAALAARERAAERLMALADAIECEPVAVALLREVAAIDSETMGRARCLRREVEGALAELATARGVLARLVGDSAPRLLERTA